MKALVIAPQPFFSRRGTPYSVYYRALVMARQGMELDILTYGQGEDVDIPGVRIIRIPRMAWLGPIKVGPSLLKLFLDVFIVIWSIGLLLRNRYAFVHAHEEAVFFCRFLKPIFRFKLIYDMHSSLPQQLTNFEFTKLRLAIRMFERLEESCLKAADAVLTICPDLAEYATKTMSDPSRHFLIENSIFEEVRLSSTTPDSYNPLPDFEIPEDSPIVFYAGTFERYQGLEMLIHAFAELSKSMPNAVLVLAGGTSSQIESLQKLAKQANVAGKCIFPGVISKPEVQHLLARSSVVVSPRIHGTNTPLKIYEILASGTPLVATDIESHSQILDDSVCLLVQPDSESFAKGMQLVLDNPELGERLARGARLLYEESYSVAAYDSKIKQVLELILETGAAAPALEGQEHAENVGVPEAS